MDAIQRDLLKQVAELDALPVGAYNIRANGETSARSTTADIDIVTKTDKPGIDIFIRPGTKKQSLHIPVIISESGLKAGMEKICGLKAENPLMNIMMKYIEEA